MTVGIVSTGIYIPQTKMTSKEIADRSTIPEDIIRQKMGIHEKPVPGEYDHTVQMAVWAAQEAIRKANIEPKDIDVVIYMGRSIKSIHCGRLRSKCRRSLGP